MRYLCPLVTSPDLTHVNPWAAIIMLVMAFLGAFMGIRLAMWWGKR